MTRAAAITAVALLAVPLSLLILLRGMQSAEYSNIPLMPAVNEDWQFVPRELPGRAESGETVFRSTISIWEAPALAHYDAVSITFGTYDSSPRLLSGTLRLEGTSCAFSTPAGATFRNNEPLLFTATPRCAALPSGEGRFQLELHTRGDARLAIWTAVPPRSMSPRADGPVLFLPRGELAAVFLDAAAHVRETETARRLDLLAFMWDLRPMVLIAVVGAGAVLLLVGGVAVAGRSRYAMAAGVGAIAAGLSVLYAVTVPPFQAPDEPTHFLSFASVNGDAALGREWTTAAAREHFQRIRWAPRERFKASDRRAPDTQHLDEIPQSPLRSPVSTAFWRAIHPVARAGTATATLLRLRLVNALLFGAAMALATALIDASIVSAMPVLVLLIVPTLPFFGMHVSNYALVTSLLVVLTAALLSVASGARNALLAALALGISVGMAILTTRSAVTVAPLVLAALVAKAGLREPMPRRPRALFWGGFVVAMAPFLTVATSYVAFLVQQVHLALSPASVTAAAAVLLVVTALAGYGIESLRARSAPSRVLRILCFAAGGALILWLIVTPIVSSIVQLPHVEEINRFYPARRPDLTHYVRRVALVAFTPFRLTDPDFYTSWTFWGGFGWVDTLLPATLVVALSMAVCAGLAASVLAGWRDNDAAEGAAIALLALGSFAAVLLAAASTLTFAPGLHGRYLLGAYLPLVGASAGWIVRMDRKRPELSVRARTSVTIAVAIIHAYALAIVLTRYV